MTTDRDAAPAAVWAEGWYAAARHVPSPNVGTRPPDTDITLAVIHSISLPPGIYGGPQIEQLFTNQLDWSSHPYFERIRGLEVSSHFVIRRDGQLLQFASVLHRAWHAGRSSWRGQDNCNDYSVGIELEGLEHEPFESVQYATLAGLLQALRAAWPIQWVAGHEHIAPGRKFDPGRAFDWVLLRSLLGWPANVFPGQDLPA